MSVHNRWQQAICTPAIFIWKTKYFSPENFYYILQTAPNIQQSLLPPHHTPNHFISKRTIHIQCKSRRSMNFCQKKKKLYNIVKFSQIISLSYFTWIYICVRKMLWYLFWLFPRDKNFYQQKWKMENPRLRQTDMNFRTTTWTINAWWTYVCRCYWFWFVCAYVFKRK